MIYPQALIAIHVDASLFRNVAHILTTEAV